MSTLAKRTQWIIKKLSTQLADKLLHSEGEFKTVLCDCLCRTVIDSNARRASKERLGWLIDTPLLEPVLLRLHKSRIDTTPISPSLNSWDIHSFSEEGIDKLLTPKDCRRLFRQACGLNQSGLVLRLLLTGHCDSIAKLQQINNTSLLLFFAIKGISSGVMHLLKRCHPKVNEKDSNGNTSLIWLAETGQAECLSALLERGANVNARSKKYLTALMCAANNGHLKSLKVLLNEESICLNDQSRLGHTALIGAVIGGHEESAKALLGAKGISVNKRDCNGLTALDWAIKLGRSEYIKALVTKTDLRVNEPNIRGMILLHFAVREGFIEGIRALLKLPGIDVNAKDDYGLTALHYAAVYGQSECLKVLLTAKGILVNEKNHCGDTALDCAIRWEFLEYITVLVTNNDLLINEPKIGGMTPLHLAAREGCIEVVRALLKSPNIDIKAKDNKGLTALHHAVEAESEECTKELATDLINEPKSDGMRPLHLAVSQGCIKIVRALLESPNIDVNAKDDDGLTVLHYIVDSGPFELLTVLLAAPNININATSPAGLTVLMIATYQNIDHSRRIHSLLKRKSILLNDLPFNVLLKAPGIDIKAKDNKGLTVLHHAVKAKSEEFIKELVVTKAVDVNEPDNNGCTALHHFVDKRLYGLNVISPQLTALLAAQNININAQNTKGYTPLHLAVMNGDVDSIYALLKEEDIDVTTKDNKGLTALDHATNKEWLSSLTVLLAKSGNANVKNNDDFTLLELSVMNNPDNHPNTFVKDILLNRVNRLHGCFIR